MNPIRQLKVLEISKENFLNPKRLKYFLKLKVNSQLVFNMLEINWLLQNIKYLPRPFAVENVFTRQLWWSFANNPRLAGPKPPINLYSTLGLAHNRSS